MKQLIMLSVLVSALTWSCKPTEYRVSREIMIDAPEKVVFDQVNNHKNRDAWSPWEQMDPDMKKSYEGPASGVGAIYKWAGNDSVGSGYLEIVEAKQNAFIRSKLTFNSPFSAETTIEWHFQNTDGKTKAEWINTGTFPWYMFWAKAQKMEDQLGPVLEEGLKQLKIVCEQKASGLPEDILQTTVASMNYYYVEREADLAEFDEDLFSEAYDEIYTYLEDDAAEIREPLFAIYHDWDEAANRAKFDVAVAVESDKPGNATVRKGETYTGKVVMRIYQGPYRGTEAVHREIYQFIEKSGMEIAGSPWESYVVGPADDPDPNNWITEIYYPVAE